MDIKLFNDTLKLINGCFPEDKGIIEDEFLYYLLGYTYKLTETKNDTYLLSLATPLEDCLTEKNTLRNVLGDNYLSVLSNSQNLTIKRLLKITLDKHPKAARDTETRLLGMQKELHTLCEKYSLPYVDSENAELLFRRLFTACITEKEKKYPCLFASQKKRQLKPATINGTLGRSDDSQNLLHCLNQYHKIIISSQPGTGKSRFVQYCLSTWNLSDYCYVSYASDLETTKNAVSFYRNASTSEKASLDDLKDKAYASSLLVIDQMNDSKKIVEELTELASYAIDIIVITTANVSCDTFYPFSLPTLSNDMLQTVFESSSGTSLSNNDRDLLFRISQKNILLISLIAGQYKQIVRQSTEQSEENTETLHQLLSNLDNTLGAHLSNENHYNLTFKHPYDNMALDLIGHIKAIYTSLLKNYKATTLLQRTTQFLCCFGDSVIPLSFFKLFPEYIQKDIDTLFEMGWIVKTDSTIQFPSLIARSIFAKELPTFADCYVPINTMADFLRNFDQTLCIPYLSNILFDFVRSINTKIKDKNNPDQKNASAEFESWQDLLYLIYNYYLENGDFLFAEKITELLNHPDISHKYSKLDLDIFKLSVHMSFPDWFKKIPEKIDEFNDGAESRLAFLQATNAPFLITSMNTAIYLYCSCSFAYYNSGCPANADIQNIENLKTYRFTLGTILHIIPNPRLNRSSSLSIPQYEYYQLCHTLMKSPECISSHLFEPFMQENKVPAFDPTIPAYQLFTGTNANYRIRSIAFTMFMRSIYRKDLQTRLYPSTYSVDSEMLILTIRCDIARLHEQINACEQIPWHTTWISLFCYLRLMRELSTLYAENNRHFFGVYYSFILKALLRRSTFTEEHLKEVYDKIIPDFLL